MRIGLSSIGRTRITASQFFAFSASMLMLAGASHFAQETFQTFKKITQNGPVLVNFEELSWWKNSEFKLAAVDDVELSSAQNRIESEVEKNQTKISTPTALVQVHKKPKFLKTQITQTRSSRVQSPKVAVSIQPSAIDTHLTSLPSAADFTQMQNVYLAMRNNFKVAIQSRPALNTHQVLVATQGLDAVPEGLSKEEEEFLTAYETAAVIVDDVIEPPTEPTLQTEARAVVVDTQSKKIESNIQVSMKPTFDKNDVVAKKIQKEVQLESPLVSPLPSDVTQAPLTIQTTALDEIPEIPDAIIEKPIQLSQSSAVSHTPKDAGTSEDLRAYTEDLVAALDSHPDPESDYPKMQGVVTQVDSQKKSQTQKLKNEASTTPPTTPPTTPTISHTFIASRAVEPQATHPVPVKKVETIARAEAPQSEVNGVTRDPNGVTISWNDHQSLDAAESLLDSDIGNSFQIGKAGRRSVLAKTEIKSQPKSLSDPKRFCDSALIGKEALLVSSSQEPISVCRRSISFEGARGEQSRWWDVRESVSHWPTLIWQKEADAFLENSRIPMLSFNTVKLLSAISRSEAQESAGIVFGKIPAGLEMSLSGRADAPTYFDKNMKPIASSDVSGARYFAFLNVAPGNPLLYISSRGGIQSAAISILVQAGHGTYINIPLPKLIKIKTSVFDANSSSPRGIPSLSVQVIGQEGKAAVTNTQGQFEILDVVVFGDHPLFLDVAPGEDGFKHRYRLSPAEASNKNLFYFNEETVAHWISQLEGGVSPASGLIVGAISSLSQEKDTVLRIGTLEKKTPLSPEVYALSAKDELIPDPKLGQNQIRFMAVQVSEGANIPSVFNTAGEMIWSELVIAQPGVINVVGP